MLCVNCVCVREIDISAIERSKLTIQPTLLELDENEALESKEKCSMCCLGVGFSRYYSRYYDNIFLVSVETVSPKFETEINESSINKFVLTLEMSEQQKSVDASALKQVDGELENLNNSLLF